MLFWILPLFSKFNLWDHYLSFSLYSNQTNYYYLNVKNTSISEIPEIFQSYITNDINNITDGILIDINKWTLAEINVPFYPETRVFRIFSKSFCDLSLINDEFLYIEKQPPLRNKSFTRFSCNNIINAPSKQIMK